MGAVAALSVSTAAHATIIVSHWNGIMSSGSDVTDVFGTGNADLSGVAYDIEVTFDTSKGAYHNYGFPYGDDLGGVSTVQGSPGLAVLTINGHSIEFGNVALDDWTFSYLAAENRGGGRTFLYADFVDRYGASQSRLDLRAIYYDGYNPASIFTPLPEDWCLGVKACDGTFSFNASGGDPGVVYGEFAPRVHTPIPEPATWVMMIAGFGMVGATLRRQRTAVVA